MNVNPLIETSLAGIGCPVDPIKHDGTEDEYIVYYTTIEVGEFYADNEEIATGTYATVDIFCKGNFKALAAEVKSRLKQTGFTIIGYGPETYEPDTGYYHVPIEIYIDD